MLKRFVERKKRLLVTEQSAFFLMPLVLLPLLIEYYLFNDYKSFFLTHKDEVVLINVAYIVLARFLMLDSAVYIFSRSKHHVHLALIQIVLLYLEVTLITIFYYATLFYLFDPFTLFHLNSDFSAQTLSLIKKHDFVLSLYISTVTFTTLGSGDWIPQTMSAMIAVVSEVILGVVQGGVFVAIVIYAHQSKLNNKN